MQRYQNPVEGSGTTLAKQCLAFAIVACLMAGCLYAINHAETIDKLGVTGRRQQSLAEALTAYLGKHQRLPCPDTDFDGFEDRTALFPYRCKAYADRANRVFAVPYRNLGLEKSDALDGWGNFMSYLLTPNHWPFSYAPTATPLTGPDGFHLDAWGEIEVLDSETARTPQRSANPHATPPTGAAVVLVSHGPNGLGAWNKSGKVNRDTSNADEKRNLSPLIAASPAGGLRVIKRPADAGFDDVVFVLSPAQLTLPLLLHGNIASGYQALLQANDVVLGEMLASCGAPPCATYALPDSVAFPGAISVWGFRYLRLAQAPISANSAGGEAYRLYAADGALLKSVSTTELKGLLLRGAGFRRAN